MDFSDNADGIWPGSEEGVSSLWAAPRAEWMMGASAWLGNLGRWHDGKRSTGRCLLEGTTDVEGDVRSHTE